MSQHLGAFWIFFSTGAATPFRTDIREQKGSCLTNKIHFPELRSAPKPWCRERWARGEEQELRESEDPGSAPKQATDCSSDLSTPILGLSKHHTPAPLSMAGP